MTKNCERDYEGSRRCLEDSLRRLRTDHVDLWQFHESRRWSSTARTTASSTGLRCSQGEGFAGAPASGGGFSNS